MLMLIITTIIFMNNLCRIVSFQSCKTLQAAEESTPAQLPNISESKVVVHLTVTDENDFAPRFGAASYTGQIPENTQKDVTVLLTPEITCEDLDSVRNTSDNDVLQFCY